MSPLDTFSRPVIGNPIVDRVLLYSGKSVETEVELGQQQGQVSDRHGFNELCSEYQYSYAMEGRTPIANPLDNLVQTVQNNSNDPFQLLKSTTLLLLKALNSSLSSTLKPRHSWPYQVFSPCHSITFSVSISLSLNVHLDVSELQRISCRRLNDSAWWGWHWKTSLIIRFNS